MKLVTTRAIGDCGICVLATYLEQSYEDVYTEAAKVDKVHRGKLGVQMPLLAQIAKAFNCTLVYKPYPVLDDDEGLLVVKWKRGSRHYKGQPFRYHIVVLTTGLIIDTADGLILPADEYLAREKGTATSLWMEPNA